MAIQMLTGFLDLVGVLLIGVVGALAVTTVQSSAPPPIVTQLLDRLGFANSSGDEVVLKLALAAALVLLAKSTISAYLTRRSFKFLANRQALVSAALARKLLARPLTFVQSRSSQQTAFALVTGASAATMGILGQIIVVATELSLLVLLATALVLVNPPIALASIAFFALIAVLLQRAMGNWAMKSGVVAAEADISSFNAIQEALGAYREITVSDRREYYVEWFQSLRWSAAKVAADTQFIGMVPKYLFEAALVLGGFALAGVLLATEDSVAAVGTLALFLAAATRVMPSLLRLQGAALGLRGAAGLATATFSLADDLATSSCDTPEVDAVTLRQKTRTAISDATSDFLPRVDVRKVSFAYPESQQPALEEITLSIQPGAFVALVGSSGAGKSTLADLILGILRPDCGEVLVAGVPPLEAVRRWPGAISYVPQQVALANGTVRANVALGVPADLIDDEAVWDALKGAHVGDFLRDNRNGLDTIVGEAGIKLSGGQRQRLGIARALYSRPRLLVLDEATSALDAETEQGVTQTLRELHGRATTIVIAHRLSTVKSADTLVYLDRGRIRATGTFDEVRRLVPQFERQSSLMGLR
jgi:ABC-type multidrug transport system fused ATPase/permease subunit